MNPRRKSTAPLVFSGALVAISMVTYGPPALAADPRDEGRQFGVLNHNPTERVADGQRYEVDVPDTLDLAARLGLAVNALTNVWFPREHWALGFNVDFSRRPAVLKINHRTDAYLNIPPKFIEALVLCRLASGNRSKLDVDRQVLRTQLEFLGTDGLTYCPTDLLKGLSKARDGQKPFSEVWAEGRMLLALSMLLQVDDDPRWEEIGKRKVDRLLALTREKDGFRYLWKSRFFAGDTPPSNSEESGDKVTGLYAGVIQDPALALAYSMGAVGHGAGLFYRVTGYEPALELSGGLARWALARLFTNADGRWDFYHFHHGLYALLAVCEYGIAAGDRLVLERVNACYRWARTMGDPVIGYYPECMPGSDSYRRRSKEGNTVEICEVADMVTLALKLTQAGMDDYTDDVDRWVRNVFAEGQLCDTRLLDRIPDSYFKSEPVTKGRYLDTDRIRERMVGSFWGWMRANEGLEVADTKQGPKLTSSGIMHCCTGNGSRTLYYVWDHIVTKNGDQVRVNLLLNRASRWLDVDSYLPAQGKVVLRIKDATKVAVRMPAWCDPTDVRVTVGDHAFKPVVHGRYLHLSLLKTGDRVTLTFPVPTRVVHRVIGDRPYKLTLRGSTVVEIDPAGVAYRLFDHEHAAKPVKTSRFISSVDGPVW